jgi:hypothetical protein
MGVQKFRSIEEMNTARLPKIEGDGFERFIRHCETFRSLARKIYRPGVTKFRTLEEAQRARMSRLSAPP